MIEQGQHQLINTYLQFFKLMLLIKCSFLFTVWENKSPATSDWYILTYFILLTLAWPLFKNYRKVNISTFCNKKIHSLSTQACQFNGWHPIVLIVHLKTKYLLYVKHYHLFSFTTNTKPQSKVKYNASIFTPRDPMSSQQILQFIVSTVN
jgi:hypothetical protein